MATNYRIVFLAIILFLFGCSSHKEHVSTKTYDRVKYTVVNNTQYSLSVIRKNVEWGRWVSTPLSTIQPYGRDSFSTQGGLTSGTEGNVEYSIYRGSFDVYWSLSHWGSVENKLPINDPHKLYDIYRVEDARNTYTVYVNEKNTAKKYNVLIMSDPQPFRLATSSNNPNKDRSEWESFNGVVSSSIKELENDKNFAFGIVNGDITEFGRRDSRDSFDKIYTSRLSSTLFIGLGNHDYANNVGDCTTTGEPSSDGCALSAVWDMNNRINEYKKMNMGAFSSYFDEDKKTGSLAYSWDYGDMHYVQLQNYPTYTTTLSPTFGADTKIKSSLSWLEKDLQSAANRGKTIILNFHDAKDHFLDESSENDLNKFKQLLGKYKVLAIFVGHTHSAGKSDLYGIPLYNSGALFQGDYLMSAVGGKCIQVSQYNGSSGKPKFIKQFSSICGK
ncbi:metallophosphoesterase [Xenorhabdus bovienii]|uniref:metallophosphoesterase n=1 Tax=Xenorhabdus bovienii TaxID=40576 RepID=UPI0023B31DA3|nr:metallophosphoesterase [Xenorhabdus bovienii]MDE9552892.1 metallophosphoesterase [Xenorhabdus bovienii]